MDENITPAPSEDFQRLLDGPMPDPSADALRSIVERHGRWRTRTLGIALAVALVAGPAGGYALRSAGTGSDKVPLAAGAAQDSRSKDSAAEHPPSNTSAGTDETASTTPAFAAPAPGSYGPMGMEPVKQLFLRDSSDGTRVRAYLHEYPQKPVFAPKCGSDSPCGPPDSITTPPPGAAGTQPVVCMPSGFLDLGVSNDQVAGSAGGPAFPAPAAGRMTLDNATVVGMGEPTPVATVIVRTGSGVANVRLKLADGRSDTMSPVDGWAALALTIDPATVVWPKAVMSPETTEPGTAPRPLLPGKGPISPESKVEVGTPYYSGPPFPKATLESLDGSGKVLDTVTLPGDPGTIQPGPPPECIVGMNRAEKGSVPLPPTTFARGPVSPPQPPPPPPASDGTQPNPSPGQTGGGSPVPATAYATSVPG